MTWCLAAEVYARVGSPPASSMFNVMDRDSVDALELPAIQAKKMLEEDAKQTDPGPLRYASTIDTAVSIDNDGTWEVLASGDRLWRLRVSCPGATDLNFGFGRFALPEGAELHIYSTRYDYYQGPYTHADNEEHGEFWSPMVPGDEAMLELFLPAHVVEQPDLWLTTCGRGYRDLFKTKDGVGAKQGSCNIDVICPQGDGWRDQIRSVGAYSLGGSLFCTGTLIMDAPGSFREYFITAGHCGLNENNAASLVVYWNFESANCGDLSGGSLADNQSGAIFRAAKYDADMCLVELDDDPDAGFDVFYSGWDRSGAAPPGSAGIHHPDGDEKAISLNSNALTTVNSCIGSGTSTHWQVDDWEMGTTEKGSSGSGLWDSSSKLLVGFLSGGSASCANPSGSDCYGKFSVAWDAECGPLDSLKQWLDPEDTGVTSVQGADPTNVPSAPSKPLSVVPAGNEVFTTGSMVIVHWDSNSVPTSAVAMVEYTTRCSGEVLRWEDDMESGTNGWTVSHGTGSVDWAQVMDFTHSGVLSWFAEDVSALSDQYLVSPSLVITEDNALTFWQRYITEETFDGGVVEISTNGTSGPWTDIACTIVKGKYTNPIDAGFGSPIASREAFSGSQSTFVQTRADLSDFAGHTAHLRFRMATDVSVGSSGWWVDDVQLYTAQVWQTVGTAAAGATSMVWTLPGEVGTNYCIRVRYKDTGYVTSDWCQSSAFELRRFDTDGDGLPDLWEIENGLDPDDDGTIGETSGGAKDGPNGALGDPDGDGQTNYDEYVGGSSADTSNSVFRAKTIAHASGVTVSFDSATGRTYGLFYTTNILSTNAWTEVTNGVSGTGATLNLLDTNDLPILHYRIEAVVE